MTMKKAPICPRCRGPLQRAERLAQRLALRAARRGVAAAARLLARPRTGCTACCKTPRCRSGCPGRCRWAGWSPGSPALVMTAAGPGPAWWPCPGPTRSAAWGRCCWSPRSRALGLGAGLAGLAGPDPGEGFAAGPPHALVRFGHHEFPLWHVEAPGRRPCSPARCWATGCGSCCGPTRRGSCCWSPCPCVTCVIPARSWICRSARSRRGCPLPQPVHDQPDRPRSP